MSKKTNNLWIDLESDSSNDEHEPSKENGCLICSIIPVLSDRNCCSKHITALSKTVGDMLPSSGKQRFHRHSKKLRPIILTSFSKNNYLSPPTSQTNHLSKSTMNKRKRISSTTQPSTRVIHVKDDEEEDESTKSHSEIILNMSQATKKMTDVIYSDPKIVLKRIRLE